MEDRQRGKKYFDTRHLGRPGLSSLGRSTRGKVDPSLPKPEDQPKRVFDITYPNTSYEFVVSCLDRNTGKRLWRQIAIEKIPHEGHHGDSDFASPSPTTERRAPLLLVWVGGHLLFLTWMANGFGVVSWGWHIWGPVWARAVRR